MYRQLKLHSFFKSMTLCFTCTIDNGDVQTSVTIGSVLIRFDVGPDDSVDSCDDKLTIHAYGVCA